MKAIVISIVIVCFNLMMAGLAHSGIMDSSPSYDNQISEQISSRMPVNASGVNEQQQLIVSSDIVDIFFSTFTFSWIMSYIPQELQPSLGWFITALNVIQAVFVGIALIELFWRRNIWETGG